MLGLLEENRAKNHVSITPSIIKNVEVSGQWILPEITLCNKMFPSAHQRPFVMVLKHVYNFFDTLPLRDEGLCPLPVNLHCS